jgi:microcin C transport system substrate-binding protein
MNKLISMLPLVLLMAACGSDTADVATSSNAGAMAGDDAEFVAGSTHLVADPPSYESVQLPDGLEWLTNDEDAEFASPDAIRGGRYTTFIQGFPLTLRLVGPDANGTFAQFTRSMGFVMPTGIHPDTLNPIPVLATHWAFGGDGKTVYYRLNPDARWSDGEPITADDFVFTKEFMQSEYIVDPWYNNEFTENIIAVRKYDDYTISVEGVEPKPRDEIFQVYSVWPTPRHFHKLDENWVADYSWRAAPGPGAYRISAVDKGQSVTLERVDDWWGDDVRYLRNRFNPDEIQLEVIRDRAVAWEYFVNGELDAFRATFPDYWHDKARGRLFDNGYVHKLQYHTETPQPAWGLWLNTDDPMLSDRNVRLGLSHSMNVHLMLDTLLRGDYGHLSQHFEGYWDYTNPDIEPREWDLAMAERYFSAAGWTERGSDGILVKDGRRLSFTVNYGYSDATPRVALLREEARKAGVELNLQLMDASASFKQAQEKKHQIALMGWGTFPVPQYWEFYHSANAHKPQTNNITNIDDPVLDQMITEYDAAIDHERRVELSHDIQQFVHDEAVFIPLWNLSFVRDVYWRWVKLPDNHATRAASYLIDPPLDEPIVHYDGLFWIDEAAKAETLEARQAGRTFEPVSIVDTTWLDR